YGRHTANPGVRGGHRAGRRSLVGVNPGCRSVEQCCARGRRYAGNHRCICGHSSGHRAHGDCYCYQAGCPGRTGFAHAAVCSWKGDTVMRARRLAWLFFVVISGCKVGPNYQPAPPTPGAEGPLVSVSPTVATTAEPPDGWWRLYHDPTLDKLLEEAFEANTDLKAAEANLQAASAALDIARDAFLPQTKAEIGSTRGRDGVTDEILELTGRRPQTIWIHEAALSLGYELDYLGRVRRSVESARADAEAVAAVHDTVKITVAAETARAYGQICAFGEQIEVAKRSLEIVSREADITAHRHDAGANSLFDVVRAQQLVAQVRSTIPPLEGQRRAALFQLAALLGRSPTMAPTEVNQCVIPPHLTDLVPVGDGATLLKRRPDIRQADRRMASATARIGAATADLYPGITLKALYGTVTPDINEFTAAGSVMWGLGPSVSWSFPNMAGPRA